MQAGDVPSTGVLSRNPENTTSFSKYALFVNIKASGLACLNGSIY